MNIYEKLLLIQQEVRATKDQWNDFSKFKYRNAEGIYEAVKPVCLNHGAVLFVTDDVTEHAGKAFVKATATLVNVEETKESVSVDGYARIPDSKKGMDDSQLTGAASSYARKYAMGGLFCLDDNKDADALPPDDKYEAYMEKKESLKKNQKRLDEAENWRYISADHIEVKMSNGKWINLDDCQLKWLEALLNMEAFEGIKADIQKRIDLIKGNE